MFYAWDRVSARLPPVWSAVVHSLATVPEDRMRRHADRRAQRRREGRSHLTWNGCPETRYAVGWTAHFRHGWWRATIRVCAQRHEVGDSLTEYDDTITSDLFCNTVTITPRAAAQIERVFATDPTLHHAWWDIVRRLASMAPIDMYHLRQEQVENGQHSWPPLPLDHLYRVHWSAYLVRGAWYVRIDDVKPDAAAP